MTSDAVVGAYAADLPATNFRMLAFMEDRAPVAELIRDRLQQAGFEVLLPKSATECEEFARHGCSAFILDIDMGRGREDEGLEALRRLKEIDKSIYCVMLTQHRDERYRSEAHDLGCDAFLGKSSKDLLADFDQVLMALDRMWLGRATKLSLSPADRASADAILSRVEAIRKDLAVERRPLISDEEKRAIVARYQELAAKSSLNPDETDELERLDASLTNIERVEADQFDSQFANSRAGRLEEALDRIEGYLREWRREPGS